MQVVNLKLKGPDLVGLRKSWPGRPVIKLKKDTFRSAHTNSYEIQQQKERKKKDEEEKGVQIEGLFSLIVKRKTIKHPLREKKQ